MINLPQSHWRQDHEEPLEPIDDLMVEAKLQQAKQIEERNRLKVGFWLGLVCLTVITGAVALVSSIF